MRGRYAEWWARTRTSDKISARLSVTTAKDADLTIPPDAPRVLVKRPPEDSDLEILYTSLLPLSWEIKHKAKKPFQTSESASHPTVAISGQSISIAGLVPGKWYILRYSWSPSFAWIGGEAREELGGLTLVRASGTTMSASFNRFQNNYLWIGWVVSLLTLSGLLYLAIRKPRGATGPTV
jgi:hypothetical protein